MVRNGKENGLLPLLPESTEEAVNQWDQISRRAERAFHFFLFFLKNH